MIHLSTKSDYAIKALVRLALADGSAPVTARDIVAFTGVPPKFLEQVMHDLRQAGLVESQRGKGGGYVIARDPASVSFADVIDLIDGRRADPLVRPLGSPSSNGGKGRMRGGDQAESPGRPGMARSAGVHARHPRLGDHRRRRRPGRRGPHVLHLTGEEQT